MLLMDTGIGRTAYSIMEQGKIDLILSSRPEDRRAIFEDAAGITKYKAQKKEALRKLEYTDANLVRLADIMKEVKRQIGSLQRQAGKARRYKALFDELRVLDTHFSRTTHDELLLAITAAEKEIDRLRNIQRSLEEQVESQEFGIREQRQQIDLLEEQIATSRQRVQELRNQADSATNRIEFNEERIGESATLLEQYHADVAAAEQRLLVQQEPIRRDRPSIKRHLRVPHHGRGPAPGKAKTGESTAVTATGSRAGRPEFSTSDPAAGKPDRSASRRSLQYSESERNRRNATGTPEARIDANRGDQKSARRPGLGDGE